MISPVLAVEAAGSGSSVPIVILVIGLVGFALAYFLVGPGQRRGPKRNADIPLAMRPYHSDEELEGRGMERAMAWGVALAVFSALFIPLYWLIEPERINRSVDNFYAADVSSGRALYQNACASCHGVNLEGGSAPHPDPNISAAWPAPALNNVVARYQDSEIVDDVREFIELTLIYGRNGSPMQAFSVGQGGVYSDNQINQIVAYILSVQTGQLPVAQTTAFGDGAQLYAANCARCHGVGLEGYIGPQLHNVFERYGWSGEDDGTLVQARAAVRQTLVNGRLVPGQAPMPAFNQLLSDDAIDAIVGHLEGVQVVGGERFGQIGGSPQSEVSS